MQLEIRSDLICSLRHIGERRLESALGLFGHQSEVGLIDGHSSLTRWTPTGSGGTVGSLVAKLHIGEHQPKNSSVWITGMATAEGIGYRLYLACVGQFLFAQPAEACADALTRCP